MTDQWGTVARESLFWWLAGALKFGPGALDEIGADAAGLGLERVLVVTDRQVVDAGVAGRAVDSLTAAGVEVQVYADVAIEPTDESCAAAHAATKDLDVDGIVAVGGGSVIDTAKAVDLLRTNGGALTDYVNAPVGAGRAPHAPLLPLIAAPTTAGSGSSSARQRSRMAWKRSVRLKAWPNPIGPDTATKPRAKRAKKQNKNLLLIDKNQSRSRFT